jgi:cytochrome b pre-mRNA-processing protein 3
MRDDVVRHAGESEAGSLFIQRLFRQRPATAAGHILYAAAAAQARTPDFYAAMAAPDTMEGRFELYSLHVILLVLRLKGAGGEAREVTQGLFDAYLESLDIALRELGVGDLSMGKKMKKLGRAFYGRVRSYEASSADPAALEDLIGRTIYETMPDADPKPLARYVERVQSALALQPLERLISGEVEWPKVIV